MRTDHPGLEIAITDIRRMIKAGYAILEEFAQAVAELKKQAKKKVA